MGIFAIAAATELASVKLGNPNYPPHIFNNNLTYDDSTVTYIVTLTINTGGHRLQLQWNHQQRKGNTDVYTTPTLRWGQWRVRGRKWWKCPPLLLFISTEQFLILFLPAPTFSILKLSFLLPYIFPSWNSAFWYHPLHAIQRSLCFDVESSGNNLLFTVSYFCSCPPKNMYHVNWTRGRDKFPQYISSISWL